jgi:hypothetical protein
VLGVAAGELAEERAAGRLVGGLEAAQELQQGAEDLFGEAGGDLVLVFAGLAEQGGEAAVVGLGEQAVGAEQHEAGAEGLAAGDGGHELEGEGEVAGGLAAGGVDEAEEGLAVVEQADGDAGLAEEALELGLWWSVPAVGWRRVRARRGRCLGAGPG